jgi:hypothetical protein
MNKTALILIGLAALGGGAYYLYKTGALVATPTFGQGTPLQQMKAGLSTKPAVSQVQMSQAPVYWM